MRRRQLCLRASSFKSSVGRNPSSRRGLPSSFKLQAPNSVHICYNSTNYTSSVGTRIYRYKFKDLNDPADVWRGPQGPKSTGIRFESRDPGIATFRDCGPRVECWRGLRSCCVRRTLRNVYARRSVSLPARRRQVVTDTDGARASGLRSGHARQRQARHTTSISNTPESGVSGVLGRLFGCCRRGSAPCAPCRTARRGRACSPGSCSACRRGIGPPGCSPHRSTRPPTNAQTHRCTHDQQSLDPPHSARTCMTVENIAARPPPPPPPPTAPPDRDATRLRRLGAPADENEDAPCARARSE